jgi:peptidoglycan/xylan/chitin deacetylase (PgdA/CDA1 family)
LANAIRLIRALGLEIISFREAMADAARYLNTPKQFAIITFDDGMASFYHDAAPILKKLQCPAINFILLDRFGGTNVWDKGHLPVDQQDPLMTLEQLQTLSQDPLFTFGSHGLLHTHLCEISPDACRNDLLRSHQGLSQLLGNSYLPVFAYPWGELNADVLALMPDTPYQFAVTTEQPAAWTATTPRFEIPRHTMTFHDRNPLYLLLKLAKRHIGLFGF